MHNGHDNELKSVAEAVREYQEREGLSDAALCREFAQLGSTKTYKRILNGDLAELNVEKQLENYRRVLELTKLQVPDEAVYDDFEHVRQICLAVDDAYREKGNERLIILEGQTGSGKTEALRIVDKRFGNAVLMCEAHGGWKIGNNPLTIMLGDLLEAARVREIQRSNGDVAAAADGRTPGASRSEAKAIAADGLPVSFAARKKKLFEWLCARKRILLIDEAQEMGPFCLNLVKSIINQTPSVVVMSVIPTLFRRMESRSYEDCIQLTGNRLQARIRIASPGEAEIEKFLERRGVEFAGDDVADQCLKKLVEMAPLHANWKFINRFARRARKGGELTSEGALRAIEKIERQRKG